MAKFLKVMLLILLFSITARANNHFITISDIEGKVHVFDKLIEQVLADLDQGVFDYDIVINGDLVGLVSQEDDLNIINKFLMFKSLLGDRLHLLAGNRELMLLERIDDPTISWINKVLYRKAFAETEFFYRNESTLIFHGAITKDNFKYHPETRAVFTTAEEMIDGIEKWFGEIKIKAINGDRDAIKFLKKYGRPTNFVNKFNSKSLLYGRYSLRNGDQGMPSRSVVKFFKDAGINLLINGHTPVGKLPVFMQHNGFGVLVTDVSRENSNYPVVHVRDGRLEVATIHPVLNKEIGFYWDIGKRSRMGRKTEYGRLIGYDDSDFSYYHSAQKVSSDGKFTFLNKLKQKAGKRGCLRTILKIFNL